MTEHVQQPCSRCGQKSRPVVTASDGRSLCLACVEALGSAANVSGEAVELLRWLTDEAANGAN